MPKENISWREKLTVNIRGGMADDHEISAEVLASSLLGLHQLAQRANTTINGKDTQLSVKIKGGFVEGSFEYQAVFDFFGAVLPIVPQVVETIKQVIEFKQFLGGEPPTKLEREPGGQSSIVENNSGNVAVFQNNTIVIGDSATATQAMIKFFKPFDNGAGQIEISGGKPSQPPAIVTEQEKNVFLKPSSDIYKEDDRERVLEVLTAQMDGRPEGWRFYDVEDDATFSAGLADHNFLLAVNQGKYGFLRGRHAAATVRTVKQKVDGRMKTTRTILSITPLNDEQERALFI